MRDFEQTGAMRLTNAQREGAAKLFTSARDDGAAMARSLRWAHDRAGQVIDPHTAVGPHAALECDLDRSIPIRSEEHTSELKSLMRISYAVFCLKKKKDNTAVLD